MTRLIPLLLLATCLIGGGASNACEKHLSGHASGSDTGSATTGR